MIYKLSRYNYCFRSGSGFALWNSFSGALLALDKQEYLALKAGRKPAFLRAKKGNGLKKAFSFPGLLMSCAGWSRIYAVHVRCISVF